MRLEVDRYLAREFHETRYNCWDLLREAWLDLTGIDIGHRTPDPPSPLAMRRRFDREEGQFRRLPEKRSPCIVLMRRPRLVPHVGLFWRERVLHIRPEGTRFERLAEATMGYPDVRFYDAAHPLDRQSLGAGELGAA